MMFERAPIEIDKKNINKLIRAASKENKQLAKALRILKKDLEDIEPIYVKLKDKMMDVNNYIISVENSVLGMSEKLFMLNEKNPMMFSEKFREILAEEADRLNEEIEEELEEIEEEKMHAKTKIDDYTPRELRAVHTYSDFKAHAKKMGYEIN